jgi:integrase/recombinase XerD
MSGGMRVLRLVPAPGTDRTDPTGPPAAVDGAALLELWAGWMRAGGASDKTISTRLGGVRALANFTGERDLTKFTTTQLVGWLARCRSAWTRRTYAQTAQAWHAFLVDQGLRADDPTARLPKPKQPRGVPRPASDGALEDVLQVAGRRARAYITLAAYQGLRVHEIAKVRGEDFQDGWLFVTGKGDQPAALPIHHTVAQLRRGWPETGWWFPGRVGGHVSAASVSATVSATFRRAGHAFTAHQLRHWFGTEVQRSTGDLRVTQELLRHRSLQSTQIYTQVSGLAKVAAVRRVGVRRSGGVS